MHPHKAVKLDKRDVRLLQLLRENARMPIAQLAKALGVNRDTVKYRMTRLEKGQVIKRMYAEIDRSVFGHLVCYVFMLLDERNKRKREQLLRELATHPNTESICEFHSNWDVQWTLVARSVEELDSIMMRVASAYKGVIVEKDTMIVVRWSKAAEGAAPDVDDKDVAILRLLAEDARANAVAIGQRVGLSADAVIKRIKALVRAKVIRRFTIITNPEAKGKEWYTFVLQMKHFDETHQARLQEFVHQHHGVVRCYKTIGTWDIVMTVIVDNQQGFHAFFKDVKTVFSDILKNYDAYAGYREQFITPLPRAVYEKGEANASPEQKREKK